MSSFTNTTKTSATWKNPVKSGEAWRYDDSNIAYDAEFDALTGAPVYYDSIGLTPTFTNTSKPSTSYTSEAKP